MIIDDDEDLSFIISDMLESYGYSVDCAADGDAAFELLSGNTYHLIMLDINLPGTTGFELCKELRETSTVPVIFASARTNEGDRIQGFEIGGDDYLPKPYSMKELLARVNALIRRTYGFGDTESTLAVHIRWLREKLERDPAAPEYIKTVYKVGYMLEVKE